MNRIIFYSFILAAFIAVLHAAPRRDHVVLKEMMKDVRNLKKMFGQSGVTVRTTESKLDNLSCYMAELKGLKKSRMQINTVEKLNRKAKQLNLLNIDCPNSENYMKNSLEQFLNQFYVHLQKKFHAAVKGL